MKGQGLEQKESFGNYGGIYFFDVAVVSGVYTQVRTLQIKHFMRRQVIVCRPYYNKNENCLCYLTISANYLRRVPEFAGF